jgi:hypothetical protein
VILHDYKSKKLLAFDDLRILNKRTNWSKSLEEMYEQNLLDFYLFEEKIKKTNASMFRKDKGELAKIEEIGKSICEFWASTFGLLYRVIWRINLVKLGQENRRIPNSAVDDFEDLFKNRIESTFELIYVYCEVHFTWLDLYLCDEEDSVKNRTKLVWFAYSAYFDSLIEASTDSNIPIVQYIKNYRIEEKLKERLEFTLLDNMNSE